MYTDDNFLYRYTKKIIRYIDRLLLSCITEDVVVTKSTIIYVSNIDSRVLLQHFNVESD